VTITSHHPLTLDVYEIIMGWLETENPPGPVLRIPILESLQAGTPLVEDNMCPVPIKQLICWRIVNETAYVPTESHGRGARIMRRDGSTVDIWYRPDWQSYAAIERILREDQC